VLYEKAPAALKEEAERLKKELAKLEKELAQIQGKLNNPEFVNKAPQAVIDKEKGKEAELLATKKKLEEGIKRAGGTEMLEYPSNYRREGGKRFFRGLS